MKVKEFSQRTHNVIQLYGDYEIADHTTFQEKEDYQPGLIANKKATSFLSSWSNDNNLREDIANHSSSKDAKTKLMTLVTEIMMDEAGYIINELIQDCERQTDILKVERVCLKELQDHLEEKTDEHNELNAAADVAKQELIEALEEELRNEPPQSDAD